MFRIVPDRFDLESVKGRFGWEVYGQLFVPYIFRTDCSGVRRKVTAIRFLEQLLYLKYKKQIREKLKNFVGLQSLTSTLNEAKLLNEINRDHCSLLFGTSVFKGHDKLVSLDDGFALNDFMQTCQNTFYGLGHGSGVLEFAVQPGSGESCAPVLRSAVDRKLVPVCFFEFEDGFIDTYKLQGWDLALIRFCGEMMHIRPEVMLGSEILAFDFEDVKLFVNLELVSWQQAKNLIPALNNPVRDWGHI